MGITAIVGRLFGVEKAQARFEAALQKLPTLDEWHRQQYVNCVSAVPAAIFWPPNPAQRKEKVLEFGIEQIDRAVNLISEDLYWHSKSRSNSPLGFSEDPRPIEYYTPKDKQECRDAAVALRELAALAKQRHKFLEANKIRRGFASAELAA